MTDKEAHDRHIRNQALTEAAEKARIHMLGLPKVHADRVVSHILAMREATETPAPAPQPAVQMPRAWLDVMGERTRQMAVEGWTPEHDDKHDHAQMAGAALCYLAEDIPHWARMQAQGCYWPWDASWWKPTDPRRNLVKAGALILAEIERRDRAALSQIGGCRMTPEQRRLARHALGLPNKSGRTYRNRFYASEGGQDMEAWRQLEAEGMAMSSPEIRRNPEKPTGRSVFWLTHKGAAAALEDGETLCPEDFPDADPS